MSRTIVIVAPGPSLTQADVDLCKPHFTIMVGNAWRMHSLGDVLYHCDERWWSHHKGVPHFYGRKISLECTKYTESLTLSSLKEGLDLNPGFVVGGRNSGYQAINLAVHYKPEKIILLGYDMKLGPNGEKHIDGQHPKNVQIGETDFEVFKAKFDTIVKPLEDLGISVYNCTRDSDLVCFKKEELEHALRA